MQPQNTIPAGLCQCGCGGETRLITRSTDDYRPGDYTRFIHGHHQRMPRNTVDKFFKKTVIDEATGCWVYTGQLNHGYGRPRFNGRYRYLHQISYEHFIGPMPEGLVIDHLCRNRACWNPEHLEPVTLGENQRRAPHVLLHEDQIPEIRRMAKTMTQGEVAKHFSVSRSVVNCIVNGRSWVHVE